MTQLSTATTISVATGVLLLRLKLCIAHHHDVASAQETHHHHVTSAQEHRAHHHDVRSANQRARSSCRVSTRTRHHHDVTPAQEHTGINSMPGQHEQHTAIPTRVSADTGAEPPRTQTTLEI